MSLPDRTLTYIPAWNLATIPDTLWHSENARRRSAARKTHAGGRPPIERPCPRCGATCPSASAARAHRCATTPAAPAPLAAQADTATPGPRHSASDTAPTSVP